MASWYSPSWISWTSWTTCSWTSCSSTTCSRTTTALWDCLRCFFSSKKEMQPFSQIGHAILNLRVCMTIWWVRHPTYDWNPRSQCLHLYFSFVCLRKCWDRASFEASLRWQ
uniref:Putative secreted protein n=1 Tax=Ixodes ricinus TaxID=34613 RepID=A0A6B0UJA4_IXORI